ncbi:MAG: hypothetical protein AB7T31_12050 [Gemmatimonadales bacterium]
MRAWVAERVRGKLWWARAPLLVLLLVPLRGYLGDPMHSSIFDGVNLAFHEMGHAAFFWLGNRILTTAGGTIFQLGIPLAAAGYLLHRQRDPFGAAVCIFWLGTSMFGAGVYAADARAQALPLVSPFGPVDVDSHDWTVMLLKYGMLSRDQEIGAALRSGGVFAMTLSLAVGAWVLWVMRAATAEAAGPAGSAKKLEAGRG